jgi:hypothetical protein
MKDENIALLFLGIHYCPLQQHESLLLVAINILLAIVLAVILNIIVPTLLLVTTFLLLVATTCTTSGGGYLGALALQLLLAFVLQRLALALHVGLLRRAAVVLQLLALLDLYRGVKET